ncbi:Cytosolic Fe-S cluster assembly factor NBP35 [Dirofilaria immitis]|nr:Cytosolic Fe-S cluster assembly factor NBP35 [Dirofilaria immitis]
MNDIPENANENCPGATSGNAGKATSCTGCPNQALCASSKTKGLDADLSGITDRLKNVKHKILILSGKGGVGKSAVAANLARALARNEKIQKDLRNSRVKEHQALKVGLLDVDICGPSQARIMGVEQESVHESGDGCGLGSLDYLLIDTPPGTSDEHISIVQFLLQAGSVDGAIIITTPQEISLLDVRKEIDFCRRTKINILGVVENMSSFTCPSCSKLSQLFPSTTGGAKQCAMGANNALLEVNIFVFLGSMKRVVITGIGIVSPFGVGRRLLFDSLLANNVALRNDEQLKIIVGRVPEYGKDCLDLSSWTPRELKRMSRGIFHPVFCPSCHCSRGGGKDAGLKESHMEETGVNVGMGIADLELIYEVGKQISEGKGRRVTPFFIPRILTNMPAGHVSIKFGMRGPQLSSCTACATGLHSVGDSATFIRMGRAETHACRALTMTCSRPFDKRRDGFVLSEGAAILILEEMEEAIKRKANIYAEVVGYGEIFCD